MRDPVEAEDHALQGHHRRLLAAAGLAGAEAVLDVGCATGQVSLDAARAVPAGAVVGMSTAPDVVAACEARAEREGVGNAQFAVADASRAAVERGGFDVVLSRFGLEAFPERRRLLDNLATALAGGGRLAFTAWRGPEDNEWLQALSRALDPESPPPVPPMAHADEIRAGLDTAGFVDVDVEAVDAAFPVGAGMDEALTWVERTELGRAHLDGVDAAKRRWVLEDVRAALLGHLGDGGVVFRSGSWLVTAAVP